MWLNLRLNNKFKAFNKVHSRCNYSKEFRSRVSKIKKKKKDVKNLIVSAIMENDKNKVVIVIQKARNLQSLPAEYKINSNFSLKQVYKLIHDFYEDKIDRIESNEAEYGITLIYTLLDFFKKKFGGNSITEKRLKDFIYGLSKYQDNPKVQIFMRQFGILDEETEFSLSEQSIYLECLRYVVSTSTPNLTTNRQEYQQEDFPSNQISTKDTK